MGFEAQRRVRVALLAGGRSGEHEVSLRSAASVRAALDALKYEVIDFLIDMSGNWTPYAISPQPGQNPGIDVVFPMLHGTFGEDGTVQGLLELAGLPYVGAGVLASALAMDKVTTKRICREAGLPVVDFIVLKKGAFEVNRVELPFGYPVFVKPSNLGSSVGITKVNARAELAGALATAALYDTKIVIEKGVLGREFECAVIDGKPPAASIPCEILPSQDFYTYEDKYLLGSARIELPAQLTSGQTSEIQKLALAAFEAICGEGMARVDFLMENSSGRFFVNEINTLPGFTSISMFPKMWEHSGLPYSNLLDRLIEMALCRADARAEIRFTR